MSDDFQMEELLAALEEARAENERLHQQNERSILSRQALEAERRRYQDLFDLAPCGYLVTDPNGTIQEANRTAARLLQVSADLLKGRPLTVFVAPEDQPFFSSRLALLKCNQEPPAGQTPSEEEVPGREVRLRTSDGLQISATLKAAGESALEGRRIGLRWLIRDMTQRKVTEARQREEAGRLRDRVKELKCLFSISDLFRKPGQVQDEVFQGIVDLIPPAWQYPEIACARLVLENRKFQTGNFRLTPWKAAADVLVNGQTKGSLEVGYREEKDWGTEGPFLPEEISLIEDIAGRTGRFIARVEAEEALRESEKRFRVLFEQAAVGVAQIESATGRFMRINQRYGDIVGYSPEEMHCRTFQEITYPEDLKEDLENMEELIAGKIREFSMEKRYLHKNGSLVWVNLTVSPMWAPGESPDYHIAVVQDITRRKRAEEAAREGRALRQAVEDAFLAGITVVDQNGRQSYVNRAFCRMVGWDQEELVGASPPFKYWPPDQWEAIGSISQSLPESQASPGGTEMILQRRNGERFWALVLSAPVIDAQGNSKGTIGSIYDITERKQIEERVRGLSQQLLRSQEEERRRISRELHDVIGQNLSALKVGMEGPWINRLKGFPEISEKFKEWAQVLQDTIRVVRDMALTLRPSSLDQLGLVKAVQQYCEEFSARNRIRVDFMAAGIGDAGLDYDTRIALYRLIQEGLININKHAAATLAVIRLVSSFPNIILRIEDNGQGFDVKKRQEEAIEEKRLGLSSMEERVTLLQGTMKIDSQPGQGTRVFIEIPSQISTGREPYGR